MEKVVNPEMDRIIANRPKDIEGWGIDADPENDPTYPMKNRNGADYERIHYEKAPQQKFEGEVFHSIERPGLTRVFGTSTPPAGLSGAVRRFAFRYSEANATHWMTLILADRIDVVQGIIDDLRKGTVPNLIEEWGWKAEWKYNRSKFVTRLLTKAVVASIAIAYLTRKRKHA